MLPLLKTSLPRFMAVQTWEQGRRLALMAFALLAVQYFVVRPWPKELPVLCGTSNAFSQGR